MNTCPVMSCFRELWSSRSKNPRWCSSGLYEERAEHAEARLKQVRELVKKKRRGARPTQGADAGGVDAAEKAKKRVKDHLRKMREAKTSKATPK